MALALAALLVSISACSHIAAADGTGKGRIDHTRSLLALRGDPPGKGDQSASSSGSSAGTAQGSSVSPAAKASEWWEDGRQEDLLNCTVTYGDNSAVTHLAELRTARLCARNCRCHSCVLADKPPACMQRHPRLRRQRTVKPE